MCQLPTPQNHMTRPANLFADLPAHANTEHFTTLLDNPHCRVERIVSFGQTSPEGFWYDQAWDEWVLLLTGAAELDLDGQILRLTPGDHYLIPAGKGHRVRMTAPDQPTVWLAIHL